MKFMIENTLSYPKSKDFRKIVASSKQLFEMKVKSVFNRSLKSFCDELKFKNAMYEICFTQKNISDISYDHGYSELSSFSRSIKARYGYSPRNIRKMTKGGFLHLFIQ
ncbi:helix-turn-helix domain-containing protein [Arachidicoccus terrestris]|uniref:helix-turn-helix domain-containing protein n=1 Tax=Arachidicoccus terrestris TaxID=2875539 RepID=UPI003743390F